MTIARKNQISLEHTPFYHCTSRCVRQAFLCGKDRFSGRDFEHRRCWLEQRLAYLSSVFAIDLFSYAIMHNHYHVVIGVDCDIAAKWSIEEVVNRWGKVFRVPADAPTSAKIAEWRKRLTSISWFMRCLNEPLARLANKEDNCKGRFWEGRYKLQALLDETALLKCMAYVDLNPVRAGISDTPETSEHTSIRSRITGNDYHLFPLVPTTHGLSPLPISREEYFCLVDITGRELRRDKRSRVPESLPPILDRIGIRNDQWLDDMTHFGHWYFRAVGSLRHIDAYCKHLGQRWLRGRRYCLVE